MSVFKKCRVALTLSAVFIVVFAVMAVNAFAADGVTVDIVSFTRGEQTDLRSSELLEARVEGYDGNVRELTYKWTSSLGTYLYVYNSHNMYGINNTDGEIEIHNTSKNVSGLSNMSGRTYNKTFSGVGYVWASVYGADISIDSLVGTITVDVYAPDGTLLASDSHTGTKVQTGGYWWWATYENRGIVPSDLEGDVSEVSFGMFEGDTKNVRILLGESSIVHITCEECFVSDAVIVEGKDIISITLDKATNEYHISSVSADSSGKAQIEITIEKGNCKFHKNVTTTRVIKVYSYEKPTTTSTSTVITLDNLDDNCRYFIGGIEGVDTVIDGKDYVVFEGLTPNTEYQIEVVGKTPDTEAVYAYVYETTKPAHIGTVEVILNGTYDTSTGTAIGERVDIQSVMPSVETLYLRYEDSVIYFPLEKTDTGVYSSTLSDGNYTVYYSEYGSDEKVQLGDQILTISGASRTRALFFNSVDYDTAGGTPDFPTEYYLVNSKVTVTDVVPEKEGYLFTHWTCSDNHVHKSGDVLTEALGKPYQLTACYVESFDVYVDIVIRHLSKDGSGRNNDNGMHDIVFTVDQRFGGAGDYSELVAHTINWDGKSEFTDAKFDATYLEQNGLDRTVYTGIAPMLVNVAKEAEYTVTSVKSGYTRNLDDITKEIDENGDLRITIEFVFDPNDFDLKFEVELDEESKKVADELKPAAVNVKVTAWGDPLGDDSEAVMWTTISQMPHTYERIVLDENGYGSGTYPVWMTTTDDDTPRPYAYRIEVVSYELKDGTLIEAINKDNANIIYHTPKNRFFTTVTVNGGYTPDGSTLNGAYYDEATKAQNGTIKGIVSIEVFEITFDPNGGTLLGTAENTVLLRQVGIPNLSDYVPTRDGGYVFDGWYIADENGNMTDEAAVSDTIIFSDKLLVAKWKEPLTIKGNIAVDATYYEHDSLSSVLILLQRIDANGYAETINTLTAPLEYSGGAYEYGTYEFAGIEDNGHGYRIKVVASNYHTHYLNDTSSAAVDNYDSYAEETVDDMYLAAFEGDTLANVHLYLHFKPESFELKYQVDASSIGDGFRPDAAEMLVLCDTGEHLDPQHWDVISQMIEDGEFVGNDTVLTNGSGAGSESVWKVKADDSSPYHYAIRVNSLTFGEEEVAFGDGLPYAIHYNGSARYSDINDAQTQMLTATVVPRMYTITFDLGSVKEIEDLKVSGMDSYITVNHTLEDTYYWSHGKAVTARPEVEGYTFLGWYDENGNAVYSISADSAANVTLTAHWVIDIEFETMTDAGYYSETRDSADKVGVISLNARISNFDVVKERISCFGLYIYNTTEAEIKATASNTDMAQLEADNGEYHALVVDIASEGFESYVLAIPYVVVDGTIITGEAMTACVSDVNKWLGPKN